MNIFYPRIISHYTALSNRFYNSLIYRKPMIVTKGTCQGDYAEKYNVGIAIHDCSSIEHEILEFMSQDYHAYADRCDKLLETFLDDYKKFEAAVVSFIKIAKYIDSASIRSPCSEYKTLYITLFIWMCT